jgi:hypothetical protein
MVEIHSLYPTAGVVSITTAPFAAVFSMLNFFSFFAVNFKQIHTRNNKEKFEKNALLVKKTFLKILFFATIIYLSLFSLAANNFCQISNHILQY